MKPLGLSQNRLGRDLGVSPRRINEIVHGKRGVTADTALRLSHYFGTSAEFWLDLQTDYDLDLARDELEEKIAREVKHFPGLWWDDLMINTLELITIIFPFPLTEASFLCNDFQK